MIQSVVTNNDFAWGVVNAVKKGTHYIIDGI